ncbi:MAG: 50S ribosomal protein L24 [Parachlamydiales bacterium]|jgi:large subunit ribosomal protein L24
MTKKRLKNIRKGDRVIAIAGNDKGRSGEVLAVIGEKVIVQGINIRKKHMKPTRDAQKGSILELERPIHRSNVMICTADDRPIKLKVHTTPEGERQLVYRDGDKQVVYRTIKKNQP